MDAMTKVRILGRLAEMQRQFAEITREILTADAAPEAARAEAAPVTPSEGTQPERVLAYLRQCPSGCTRTQLGAVFQDMGANSLSGAIQRLKDRGLLEVLGRGRYRVRVS